MNTRTFGRDVLIISFSAFFADMGYQVLMAGFPYFLVFVLGAPVYLYGIAEALNFGIGSLFAYIGGRAGDRYGHRKIAVIGNALIPILSFTAFTRDAAGAIAIRSTGWWMRNFRTPSRRVMFANAVNSENRGRAFGLLHGLDVGGGLIATVILIVLLSSKVEIRTIFLITLIPITISTLLLLFTRKGLNQVKSASGNDKRISHGNRKTFVAILIATSLFGFSYYSMGYPIITIISDTSNPVLGIGSYSVFMGLSALAGFMYSSFAAKKEIRILGLAGYFLSAIGSLVFVIVLHFNEPSVFLYAGVGIIAFGTGAVETFEPTIVSRISSGLGAGRSMGWLSSSRSIGLFAGNIIMGLLYVVSSEYSYLYAFTVAAVSAGIVLIGGRNYNSQRLS
jgi:Major Facilitator Superfamily.